MDKYKALYDTCEDYKQYVDRYMVKHNLTLEVALTHRIITDYAEDIWYEREYNV